MRVIITDGEDQITVAVDPTNTIRSIKEKIYMTLGHEVSKQSVVFADFEVLDNQMLQDANIQHRSTLHLTLKEDEEMAAGDTRLPSASGDETPGKETPGVPSLAAEVSRRLRPAPAHSNPLEPVPLRARTVEEGDPYATEEGVDPEQIPIADSGAFFDDLDDIELVEVDQNNPVEVALQKFGLHKWAQRQRDFEDFIRLTLTRMEVGLTERMDLQDRRMDTHKAQIDALQKKYDALLQMVEELRTADTGRIGVPLVGFPASVGSRGTEGRMGPNRIRIRGWAPYRSENTARIRRDEYEQHVKTLKGMLPSHVQSMVRFESAYATNHQILARVQGGGEQCWMVQEVMQQKIEELGFIVRGHVVKATFEPTPERKRWYNKFFSNLRALETLVDASRLDADPKGLTIHAKPGYDVVGKVDRKISAFRLEETSIKALGLTKERVEQAAS